MKKFSALLLFLLFINLTVFSQTKQKIDSINASAFKIRSSHRDSSRMLGYEALVLSNKINYKRGSNMARLILGIHYCNLNKLDSASKYLDLSYDYFSSSKDKETNGISAWYKGKLYQRLNNFKRAYDYLSIAEKLFQEEGNTTYLIYVLTEHGVYYEMQNNYNKALEYYLKVLKISSGQSPEVIMRIESNLSSIYTKMGMFDDALNYSHNALKISYHLNSDRDIFGESFNLGKIHAQIGNKDSAKYYFEKCSQIGRSKNIQYYELANVYPEIANYYQDKGDYLTAKKYLIEAEKVGIGYNLTWVYLKLSENYKLENKKDSSIYYLYKAKSLSQDRESNEGLLKTYKLLMEHYAVIKNYDSALYYSQKVNSISDSIYNEKRDQRFDQLKVQVETLEQENEINALKFEQYETKIRNRIFAVVAVFLLLTTILAFWVYRNIQRKKHQRLEHKKQQLEKQLELSQKKLSNHTLSMIQKNNVFDEIEVELKGIRARCTGNIDPGLKKIQRDINLSRSLENDWSNFSNLFGEIHTTFFNYLEKNHPELSDYEMRLCALMKMKLTNKEIASMLNIEHKSVKMAKYRLKKKLGIGEELSLSDFIANVE